MKKRITNNSVPNSPAESKQSGAVTNPPVNLRNRYGKWNYRFVFRGREYSGPTTFPADEENRAAAELFVQQVRMGLEHGRPALAKLASVSDGFSDVADRFLIWCKDVEYKQKPSTAERIRVSFVSLKHFFANAPLTMVNAVAIERYKDSRLTTDQVEMVTLRHDLHALSVFFRKYVVKRNLAGSNPMEKGKVSIPSDAEAIREHVVTDKEEKAYFAAAASIFAIHKKSFVDAQPTLADVARIMIEQGCRPEEILASKIINFDQAAKTLFISGGKSRSARRTLHLSEASMAILSRRFEFSSKAKSQWLFPSLRHPGHHITQLGTPHERVCREADVSFRIYDFRHTFATRAIEAGVPVAVVAAILGHSSLRTIHRYVHPSADAQRSAMKLMDDKKAQKVG